MSDEDMIEVIYEASGDVKVTIPNSITIEYVIKHFDEIKKYDKEEYPIFHFIFMAWVTSQNYKFENLKAIKKKEYIVMVILNYIIFLLNIYKKN